MADRRRPMGWLRRASLLLAFAVVVTVAVGAFATERLVRTLQVEGLRQTARTSVRIVTESARARIDGEVARARAIAEADAIGAWFSLPAEPALRFAAEIEAEGIVGLLDAGRLVLTPVADAGSYVVDADRGGSLQQPADRLSASDPADRWFFELIGSEDPYRILVDRNELLDATRIAIHVVERDGERPLGVVSTSIDLADFLADVLEAGRTVLDEGAEQVDARTIVVRSGSIIADSAAPLDVDLLREGRFDDGPQLRTMLTRPADRNRLAEMLRGVSSGAARTDAIDVEMNGRQVVLAATYVPAFEWFIVATFAVPDRAFGGPGTLFGGVMALVFLLLGVLVLLRLQRDFVQPLRTLTDAAERLAQGRTGDTPELRRSDELGVLADALRRIDTGIDRSERAVRQSSDLLTTRLQSASSPSELAASFFTIFAEVLDIGRGSLYLAEGDRLRLGGAYAPGTTPPPDAIAFGEGLVGQCAADRKVRWVHDVPDGEGAVSDAFGATRATTLLLMPLEVAGRLRGVLEIGLLRPLTKAERALLEGAIPALTMRLDHLDLLARLRAERAGEDADVDASGVDASGVDDA